MDNNLKRKKATSPDIAFDAEAVIGGKQGVFSSRGKHYNVQIKGIPQCTDACPAGVNVKAYVNLIANRKFEEAVEVIRQANPFPAVCGRVCTRPCEDTCELGEHGDSISIRALKRYASDYELSRRPAAIPPCTPIYKQHIAIIGSGPAGLTAAVDLIQMGYPVTVFEEKKRPGGMLQYGIPTYRLPDRILHREIDWIQALGITIHTEKKISDPTSLFKKGYAAILIAGGAPKSFPLGIEGEDAKGMIDALQFLRDINSGKPPTIKGNVVVIGGGSTAIDAARSSIRLGATSVTIAYRRRKTDMPADTEEIHAAQQEHIDIVPLAIPHKILVKQGKVNGIEFVKAKLGKVDASGRRSPLPIKNSEFVLKADYIIPAIGAMPDVGPIKGAKVTTSKGVIDVSSNGHTIIDGIFAAGDVEMGPSSVVDAIGRGHLAAQGIHEYLQGTISPKTEDMIKTIQIYLGSRLKSHTTYPPQKLVKKDKVDSFEEVEQSLTDFQAVEEASRCFSCGPCYACPICLPNCKNKQLVAQIDDTTVLVKSPLDLSLELSEKGPTMFKLTTDESTKSMTLYSLTSHVDESLCIGCGRCEEVCAYRAIKNIISKDKRAISQVAHDSCASCSACVSECASGAISQGYMSDQDILKRLEEKTTPYPGVKGLISFWSTPSPVFNAYEGFVELMSGRKPSPSFLIRALARCGRGLLVIKPDQISGSHYLPWEEPPEDIIQNTWKILRLIGISPDRIKYVDLPKGGNPRTLLQQFSTELDKKNLPPLPTPHTLSIQSPLGEALALLKILSATPEKTPIDELRDTPSQQQGKIVLYEGCLQLLHGMGIAHKFYDITPTRTAIQSLVKTMNIHTRSIKGLSCPAHSLRTSNNTDIEKIISTIQTKNITLLQKIQPVKILCATPESYQSFTQEYKDYSITSLLEEILQKFRLLQQQIHPLKQTIALHPACGMKKDPFYIRIKQILEKIPGITIVELSSTCGHTMFEKLSGESKEQAITLMNEAIQKGADCILCTSPYCQTHLLLCSREGSWQSVDIPITDVYQFLSASLTGEYYD